MSDLIHEDMLRLCQEKYSMVFKKLGSDFYSACPFHADGKRGNFRINQVKNLWHCDVCDIGGDDIEFIARKEGKHRDDVCRERSAGKHQPHVNVVASYDYVDKFGALVFQVCRLQPKSFRQRRPDGRGGWLWNMEGIERVLYRLPDVLRPKTQYVWVVEGEKDVETLVNAGHVATTNAGGAGKWADAYSLCLKNKNVLLCGDNDEPGRKHMAKVAESLELHAASISHVELPRQFKDVSDLAASFNDQVKFRDALQGLVEKAPVLMRGGTLPIKSMAELQDEYRTHVVSSRQYAVRLSDWIPGLSCVRPLVAGELACIVGDTGSSKTYVLQHLAIHCKVPTLLFELELPNSLTFERFVAVARDMAAQEVYDTYDAGHSADFADLSHIYTCSRARLSPEDVESIILKSELKMGVRPVLVLLDYVQLMRGQGKGRYEQISYVAEQMKIVAKNTGTVIVMASQVNRNTEGEITLHAAKDSGSIENSCGFMLGIWPHSKEAGVLCMKILKNTKGQPGKVIKCKMFGKSMRIVEIDERTEEPTE